METGIVGRDRRVIGVRSTETKGLSGVSGRATSIFLYGGLGVSDGWKVKFATWKVLVCMRFAGVWMSLVPVWEYSNCAVLAIHK